METLADALQHYRNDSKITREGNYLQLILPKGTAKMDEINAWCFSKGITLNHLVFKKKKLEAKFFELTNN
jgi:ABC-2 type transport system ATP-binding protein